MAWHLDTIISVSGTRHYEGAQMCRPPPHTDPYYERTNQFWFESAQSRGHCGGTWWVSQVKNCCLICQPWPDWAGRLIVLCLEEFWASWAGPRWDSDTEDLEEHCLQACRVFISNRDCFGNWRQRKIYFAEIIRVDTVNSLRCLWSPLSWSRAMSCWLQIQLT